MTGQPVKAMPSHGQQRALLFHVWQSTMRVRSSSTTVRSAEAPSAITPSPCHFSGSSAAGALVIFVKMSSSGTSGWFFAR